jgi:hypothetical protein
MKRFAFLVIIISFSVLLWSCSEETQPPTSAMEDVESHAMEEEDFNAEINHNDHRSVVEYEVTLENLTPATGAGSSQPFSPPVLATHKSRMRIFKKHHYASDELRQIAEDAVNAPMVEKLSNSKKVFDVVEGTEVIFPGGSVSYTISAKRGYHKLSLVSMLVNTNDAFTGISKARLPRHGEKVYYLYAYDAGTEKNTEMTDHIPGPCCGNHFAGIPTHRKIKIHRGIKGTGDLDPAVYGWERKVAKLTIRRIN